MPKSGDSYHHGDLRAACPYAARELLEENGGAGSSLRAVARRAGVSPTAPYRHYAYRDASPPRRATGSSPGYLAAAHPSPSTLNDLAAVPVA